MTPVIHKQKHILEGSTLTFRDCHCKDVRAYYKIHAVLQSNLRLSALILSDFAIGSYCKVERLQRYDALPSPSTSSLSRSSFWCTVALGLLATGCHFVQLRLLE